MFFCVWVAPEVVSQTLYVGSLCLNPLVVQGKAVYLGYLATEPCFQLFDIMQRHFLGAQSSHEITSRFYSLLRVGRVVFSSPSLNATRIEFVDIALDMKQALFMPLFYL